MQAGLKAAGVPSAIYYPKPLHHQPAYRDAHDGSTLPVSEDLATRIMALPLHPDLTDQDVERICDAVLASV
jgi:dTDP-4-amino-4,6-dideoxygalactose transaminase